MSRGHASPAPILLPVLTALSASILNMLLLSRTPLFWYPVVDARWHHAWAGLVAGGELFAYAPYFRAPLYPWLLGAVYSLTGLSVTAGAILSCACHAASAGILYRICDRRMPRPWAVGCAMAWALWGTAVFYSSTLLIEPLYILLLLISFDLLDSGRIGAGSLLLGLSSIARPSALILLLAVPFTGMRKRSLPLLLLAAAAPAAVWCVNASRGDPGTLISWQGGINLYLGNGPEADGFTAFAPGPVPADTCGTLPYSDNVEAASILLAPPGSSGSEASSWWTRRALARIASDPAGWAALLVRKTALVLSPVEIPSNYDPAYFRQYSPVLRLLIWPAPAGFPFILLWALLPGALVAGRPDRRTVLLAAWSLLLLAGVVAFFVTARFRLPAVPFLIVLLAGRAREAGRKALLLAPAGLAAGLLLTLWAGDLVRVSGVNMPFHDALAHFEQGRVDEARNLFLQAIAVGSLREDGISMNRAEAMYDLGLLEAREGRVREAVGWWEAALSEYPGFEPARRALDSSSGNADPGDGLYSP
jgi:hypothetical protein